MIKRRAAVALPHVTWLPHVSGDGDQRRTWRNGGSLPSVARADEALRPDGGQGDGGRDEHIVI